MPLRATLLLALILSSTLSFSQVAREPEVELVRAAHVSNLIHFKNIGEALESSFELSRWAIRQESGFKHVLFGGRKRGQDQFRVGNKMGDEVYYIVGFVVSDDSKFVAVESLQMRNDDTPMREWEDGRALNEFFKWVDDRKSVPR